MSNQSNITKLKYIKELNSAVLKANISLTKQTHLLDHPPKASRSSPVLRLFIQTAVSLPITTCLWQANIHYLHLSFLLLLCAIIAPSSTPHISGRLIPAPLSTAISRRTESGNPQVFIKSLSRQQCRCCHLSRL